MNNGKSVAYYYVETTKFMKLHLFLAVHGGGYNLSLLNFWATEGDVLFTSKQRWLPARNGKASEAFVNVNNNNNNKHCGHENLSYQKVTR